MKEKMKLTVLIIVVVALVVLIGLVIFNGVNAMTNKTQNPVAIFEIQDYGTVKMELYPEYAPNTVANFIALIEAKYYNNKAVYGKDDICLYMARDTSDEAEGPKVSLIDSSIEADSDEDYEYEINGEFIANEFEQNTLRHEKGVVSLNRSDYTAYGLTEESYNSGKARFSVMMTSAPNLNGVYCAFGKVTEGLEILEKIYNEVAIAESEETEQTEQSTLKEFATMPVITSATVEKYGVDYGKPEVHKAFDIQEYINQLYSNYSY